MIKLLDAAFSVTDRAWQELKKKTHTHTHKQDFQAITKKIRL